MVFLLILHKNKEILILNYKQYHYYYYPNHCYYPTTITAIIITNITFSFALTILFSENYSSLDQVLLRSARRILADCWLRL